MPLPDHPKRIDLSASGSFSFQIGVDHDAVVHLMTHVDEAKDRFLRAPLLPRVVMLLEREIQACSVSYTQRIEGGLLSEAETDAALHLPPGIPPTPDQTRVIAIGNACVKVREAVSSPGWRLTPAYIRSIHEIVSEGVPHERNRPGVLRDGKICLPGSGADEFGARRFAPPEHAGDVERLVDGLAAWHDELASRGVPALVRAPLVHYHFELIHPFWAGNGLVGRLLEASILHAAGYGLASFCLWRYYAERVDRYYALFDECRKASLRGEANPCTSFVSFHLEAALSAYYRKFDRLSGIVGNLLFEGELRRLRDEGGINLRQYAIASRLLESGATVSLEQLRRSPWYEALYRKMAEKTKQRDLRHLREMSLVTVDGSGLVRPAFVRVEV